MLLSTIFTSGGMPIAGLTPSITIYNASTAAIVVSGVMTDLVSGFYTYDFTEYDTGTDYLIMADAGASLSSYERYIAIANQSGTSADVWNITVSGLDGTEYSYGTMLDNLHAINAGGKWEISGTQLILYDRDTTTVIATFNLNSATSPTTRTIV